MTQKFLPGCDTLEHVESVQRTCLCCGICCVRFLALCELGYNSSFSPGPIQRRLGLWSSPLWWYVPGSALLALVPLLLRALGVVSQKASMIYELNILIYGYVFRCVYFFAAPAAWQDVDQVLAAWCGMCTGLAGMEVGRSMLQMGGFMLELTLRDRFAPFVIVLCAAYGRYQHFSAPSSPEDPRTIVYSVALTALVGAGHVAVASFSGMCISLQQSQSFIHEQRDVYVGLLESATNGFCSFRKDCDGRLQFADMSPTLQRLLGTSMSTVAVSQVTAASNDVDCIEASAHDSCAQAAGTPFIITCIAPCEDREGHAEFEARVIPFRPPEGTLKFCFMLASEKRSILKNESGSQALQHTPDSGSSETDQDDAAPPDKEAVIDDDNQSYITFALTESTFIKQPRLDKSAETRSVGTQTTASGNRRPPCIPNQVHAHQATEERQVSESETSEGSGIVRSVDGMLSAFAPTDFACQIQTICWLAKHWNVCRIGGCCCPWHVTLLAMKHVLKRTSKGSCQPLWSPLSGWQCARCACMNHEDNAFCDICNLKRSNE